MQYLNIEVADTIGDFMVTLQDRSQKVLGDLEDILDYFANQGWYFVAVLPRLWRPDATAGTGLELSAFTLIFQRGAPVLP